MDLVPSLDSVHPHANFRLAERQRVIFAPGHWRVPGDYAGAEAEEPDPVFEFSPGTGTKPIGTHPDFVSVPGGNWQARSKRALRPGS
jgi:hypothetical protein